VLVVPWVVMQELDALKSNKEKKVGERARRAIASLHSCFSNRHPPHEGGDPGGGAWGGGG